MGQRVCGDERTGRGDAAVGIWSAQMLVALFHKDTTGGTKVFLLIGRLMTNKSQGYIDLLEVLYRIISIGFEGQYRSIPDGLRQHEEIRQLVYTEISQARPPVPLALSPQWQGEGAATFKMLRRVPVWVTASVLGLAVFGQFVWYKYQLLLQSEAVISQIAALGKPAVVTAWRLKGLLQEEIEQGKVAVIEDAQRSRVLVKGNELRMSGQGAIHSVPQPLLNKLALEIAGMPGVMVQVSAPPGMLSQARAFGLTTRPSMILPMSLKMLKTGVWSSISRLPPVHPTPSLYGKNTGKVTRSLVLQSAPHDHWRWFGGIGVGIFQIGRGCKAKRGVHGQKLRLIHAHGQSQFLDLGSLCVLDRCMHQVLRQALATIVGQDAHAQNFSHASVASQR